MLPEQRRRDILALVKQHGAITVLELKEQLNVTAATIRKDLADLEREGLLVRTHGGAISPGYGRGHDLPVRVRQTMLSSEKQMLGRMAATLIQPGDTIMLDNSSTISFLALHLGQVRDVAVVTNSWAAVEQLARHNVRVISSGGVLDRESMSFLGGETEETLARYHVDKAFLSTKGISIEYGLTDARLEQARIHRVMVKAAERVILVADHSKFDTICFAEVAPLARVSVVVTDNEPPQPYRDFFADNHVQVLVGNAGAIPDEAEV
ncbi:MAG: DeoR/GlpR family DNA-binding transcription regulator [Bacillota bacterium]